MVQATTASPREVNIGRPPVYIGDSGQIVTLPVHEAFLSSRANRRILVIHRRGRKTSLSLEEVFRYLINNPRIIGKTLAPRRKQAKEIIWNDPDMLFHPNICPPEIIADVNRSDLTVKLKNGSMYYLDGADDPQFQRGGNVKVLHLAEAGDHKEETWTQIYEPVLKANKGIAIFEGNPRGRNWYHKLFANAPNRVGWERFILSAADSPIFSPEDLKDLERSLPYNVFASEYLCEWVDSVGTVFRTFRERATSLTQDAQPGRSYRIGFDLAKIVDWTVGSVVDKHTWDQVRLERWNQVDWTMQKERMKTMIQAYSKKENRNSVEVLIEGNGPGNPIYDDLYAWAMTQKDHDIMLVNFTTTMESKNMLVQNFSMLCDQGFIAILPDESLMSELEIFTYEKTANGFKYSAPDGYHDDTVMATLLSYWDLGGKLPLPDLSEAPKTQWGFSSEQIKRIHENRNPNIIL